MSSRPDLTRSKAIDAGKRAQQRVEGIEDLMAMMILNGSRPMEVMRSPANGKFYTIRGGKKRQVEVDLPHWCQYCDRVIAEGWMKWDNGLYRCLTCMDSGIPVPEWPAKPNREGCELVNLLYANTQVEPLGAPKSLVALGLSSPNEARIALL